MPATDPAAHSMQGGSVSASEQLQQRIWELHRAGYAAEAAAAHFRTAANRLRDGDPVHCLAESKLAQDLLRPFLPSLPVRAEPVRPDWRARGKSLLRGLAENLKILLPLILVLGLLAYGLLSGGEDDLTRGDCDITPADAARSTAHPEP
jgi:hypothetical protein